MMRTTLLFALAGFAVTPATVFAQNAPKSATQSTAGGAFSYLDDEAEAGGYDVIATVAKLPVEWSLAEQENGDGYRLRLAADSIELRLHRKSGDTVLASAKTPLYGGAFVAQRRGSRWRVLNGNRVVLEAENNGWNEGRIGFRGAVKGARVQPVEEIFFDDDFMRVKAEVALAAEYRANPQKGVRISDVKQDETLWGGAVGKWSTTGLSENSEAQVAQSVNAFAFKADAVGPNLSFAGRPFWSDYGYEASVRPQGASSVGLVFYAQDGRNYLMMRWSEGENGQAQLLAVVDGKTRVLDSTAGGFESKQWYRMKVTVEGGVLRGFVDDNEVLRARTGFFGRGQIGVFADNPAAGASAFFDDVRVRSRRDFHDDFSRVVAGRWETVGGEWTWKDRAIPVGTAGAMAVMGENDWRDYTANAQLSIPADGAAGLMLHHQSGKGAYLLRVAGSKSSQPFAGRAQIVKTAGGKTVVLHETRIGSRFDNRDVMWNFSDERGYLRATADGKRVVDAFDESLEAGRAGLWAARGGKGVPSARAFSVEFPEARPTWAKVPEMYELEMQAQTMGGWSTPAGFWLSARPIGSENGGVTPTATGTTTTPATTPAGAPSGTTTLWHKGAFWGDGRLAFKLPALTAGQMFGLALAQSGASQNDLSLNFTLDKETLTVKLVRDGGDKKAAAREIAAKSIKLTGAPTENSVEVLQRGGFLIVRLKNDKAETPTTLLAARVRS